MTNPLIEHAMLNLWAVPNQDFQHNIELARITPPGGVLREYPLLWDTLTVPEIENKREYFHFYQIGQVPPRLLDILPPTNCWINIEELNKQFNILVDVYSYFGYIVPRDHVWISAIYNKNVVLAIRNNLKIDYGTNKKTNNHGVRVNEKFKLDHDQLVIRFYSNAWFEDTIFTENAVDPKNPIRYVHKTIKSQSDYDEFKIKVDAIRNEFSDKGLGISYVDGFHVEDFKGYTDGYIGKHLWFMWDESFKFSKRFELRNLSSFISKTKKGGRKYLLVMDGVYDEIDFYDDIDFYIVNRYSNKGVYYTRVSDFIEQSPINQITHNAYSLKADFIEDYITTHDFLGTIDDVDIIAYVRQGGRKTGIQQTKNRISELYKLPYTDIVDTMINVPAVLKEWRAEELEDSIYNKVIAGSLSTLTENNVVQAYGYNALAHLFAKPLVFVKNNGYTAPLIANIADNETKQGNKSVWVYDDNGLMIGYYNEKSINKENRIDKIKYKNASMVEVFNMTISKEGFTVFNNTDVESDKLDQYGFRVFTYRIINGKITGLDDITETKLYTFTSGKRKTKSKIEFKWNLLTQADLLPMVLVLDKMFVYETISNNDGVIDFDVSLNNKVNNAIVPGVVDVFADGKSLIENVDYWMQYPRIVIVNKEINRITDCKIVVRAYGFLNPVENKPWKAIETGFVKNGMMSIDGIYNVRTNKNIRVIYDNKLIKLEDGNYGEYLLGNNFTDGRPYSISDYVLPLENLFEDKSITTYTLYKEVLDFDEKVSAYLTPRLPENKSPTPMVVQTRWQVISPVISTLLYLFSKGYVFDITVNDNFDNEIIDKWFEQFKWLLNFDPAHQQVDDNYFKIVPHAGTTNYQITQKEYEILEWVIKLYLHNRVDLTDNVTIRDI